MSDFACGRSPRDRKVHAEAKIEPGAESFPFAFGELVLLLYFVLLFLEIGFFICNFSGTFRT